MRRPSAVCATVALAALAALGACSTPAPRLRVVDATLAERTSDGFVVLFTIEGENRGKTSLPLHEVNYSLDMGGKRVFSGVRSPEATLPREGVATLRLPAAVPTAAWTGEDPVGAEYTLRGALTYISPGALAEVLFDSGVRRPEVSFSQSGVVRAPQ